MMHSQAPVFSLVDDDGNVFSEKNLLGRHSLVFFGFTNCGSVCPRALSRIRGAVTQTPGAAEKFRMLYITVDPERDTPAVMKSFLRKTYPGFVGLTGSAEQIAGAKSAFHVYSRASSPSADGDYVVAHTAITYLLDPAGQIVDHFSDAVEQNDIAEHLLMVKANVSCRVMP
jgi:protein SCO1/2